MSITVTKEFRQAFKVCMEAYGVTGEELEFEKERCRTNYQEAERCYLSIAEKIKADRV